MPLTQTLLSQLNHPDICFIVYTGKGTLRKGTLQTKKENTIDIIGCTYRLSGIVYLKPHHY